MNYLYGELNEHVTAVEYEGVNTPTINVTVDNSDRTISANLRPLTPENLGIGLPPDDGHKYVLTCEYVKQGDQKTPVFKWITFSYPDYAIASDFTINRDDLTVETPNICPGCVCGGGTTG